jgi:hypothetical protein
MLYSNLCIEIVKKLFNTVIFFITKEFSLFMCISLYFILITTENKKFITALYLSFSKLIQLVMLLHDLYNKQLFSQIEENRFYKQLYFSNFIN